MPIESATYISDLNPLNPVHTDGLNQADIQIRLLKTVLQTTFPALTAAVTATPADLNAVHGMVTTVGTLGTNRVRNDIAQTMAGPLTITAGLNAATIAKGGNELVPTGIIAMWSGLTSNVPAGWHLCDGTAGTPNLAGMFIVGAGVSGPAPGATGGTNLQTITTSTVAGHSHGGATALAGSHSHSGGTDVQGAHSHGGNTAGYALTVNDIPSHTHTYGTVNDGGSGVLAGGRNGAVVNTSTTNATGGGAAHVHGISSDGAHGHNIATSTDPGHVHAINTDGSHSHTVSIDVRPTYYAICLIMKL